MREVVTLPCAKHGHPAELPPALHAWLAFFLMVAENSDMATYERNNGKTFRQARLNIALIQAICQDNDLPFTATFDRLAVINKHYQIDVKEPKK